MEMKLKELMSTRDVCELLGISKGTVWALIKKGKLSPIRFMPKLNIYKRAEVLALAKERSVKIEDYDEKD